MAVLEVRAYAKLNLALDVLGRRADGYHEMRMVMQSVTLSDRIRLETGTGRPLRMTTDLGFLPSNEKNLAAVAALRLCEAAGVSSEGLAIDLWKTIPVCAGLAGGSADAAAVLRGLNRLMRLGLSSAELAEIGARVGSDVPYCVRGGTALAEGRGGTAHAAAAAAPLSCGFVQAGVFRFHAGPVRAHRRRAPAPPSRIPWACWARWKRATWRAWPGGCTTYLRTPFPAPCGRDRGDPEQPDPVWRPGGPA